MNVYLIGKTEPHLFPEVGEGWDEFMPGKAKGSEFERRIKNEFFAHGADVSTGQELIEFAGRLCYESFDLPSPKTATNSGYIQNIISLGHESVLEHASVTLYVEGVSRNLSHELIRHRHLSFSELSQRYVDMEDANVITPPAYRDGEYVEADPLSEAHKNRYTSEVANLQTIGHSRKQAREAARYGLPAGVETKFVVSGNLRAWRDVLKKRLSVHADAEMQIFATTVHDILLTEFPDVFADIDYETE